MHKELEAKAPAVEKRGKLKKKNEGAYVYGTLRRTGGKPKRELDVRNIRKKTK